MRLSFFLASVVLGFLVFFSCLTGCGSDGVFPIGDDPFGSPSEPVDVMDYSLDEGGTTPLIHLPFAAGFESQCTQGPKGSTSHSGISTKFDVDFDTSNTRKQDLYAPISGIAYVHTEDASKNFGRHVNIDLGNGTYVILGHMSEVTVQNGAFVNLGQKIGFEGCTGYCSGDHVHIGLHQGDARKLGQEGTSIPVRYMVLDKTTKSGPFSLDASMLVCGIKALGDSVNGRTYISVLPPESVTKPSVPEPSVPRQPATPKNPDPVPPTGSTSPKDDVWVNDYGLDGVQETLMLSASRWQNVALSGKPAYVWGMGGCFDGKLTSADSVSAEYGYYQVDFSQKNIPCTGDLTLISATGTDGSPPNASMTNWNWWQNAAFCSLGSSFCHLQKNGQPWEEWLIRVSWDPSIGLTAIGNGFTKNAQLP